MVEGRNNWHIMPQTIKCSKAYEQLKIECELLLNQQFSFTDNWDMEPCATPYTVSPMDWSFQPSDDPEWVYMLNRQEYLWKLAFVYAVEQDERYLQKLLFYMFDWIEHVKQWHPKQDTSRTLDTGIRCLTWLKVLRICQSLHCLTDEQEKIIVQSIKEQLTYLKNNYRKKDNLSNWGIFQTVAMIVAYEQYHDICDFEALYQFADDKLMTQVQTQVLEDGVQYEQSFMYHVEVYRALLELIVLVPRYKEQLNDTLLKMADYIAMMKTPDSMSIAFGDSDRHNVDDILQLSAIVLQTGRYKYNHDAVDLYTLFLLGEESILIWANLPIHAIDSNSRHFDCIGQTCVTRHNSYLFFKCGPMGSAHSHIDNNSICLYHNNMPIFTDSGRYTYTPTIQRYQLKSHLGHSTCWIDDDGINDVIGSWEYAKFPQFMSHQFKQATGNYWMQGIYRTDYLYNRQVVMVKDDIFLIVDQVYAMGRHQLTTQFVLDERVSVSSTKLNTLNIYTNNQYSIEDTVISPKYNQLVTTKKLKKVTTFENSHFDYTLLVNEQLCLTRLDVKQSDGRIVDNGLAFEIVGENQHVIVIFVDKDIFQGEKLLQVGGYLVRGKCVVIDCLTKKITRLK